MISTRSSFVAALLAAAFVTVSGMSAARADHTHDGGEADAEPLTVAFTVADVAILGLDSYWAVKGERPGRLWGAAEVALGGAQLVWNFSNAVQGHDDDLSMGINTVAAGAVILHGAYVLIRGEKVAPRETRLAPMAASDGAGVMIFGQF